MFRSLSPARRSPVRAVATLLYARTAGDDRPAPALGRALAAAVLAEVSPDATVGRQWARQAGTAIPMAAAELGRTDLLDCLEAACRRHAGDTRGAAQPRQLAADVLAEVLGGVLSGVVGGLLGFPICLLLASIGGTHHEGMIAVVVIGPWLGITLVAPVGVYLAGRFRGWRGSLWALPVGIPVVGVAVAVLALLPETSPIHGSAIAVFLVGGPILALASAAVVFHCTRRERGFAPPAVP